MTKQVVKHLAYAASVEEVATMLADPTFREEVLTRQKVLRHSVSIEGGHVLIEQVQTAHGLPSFARKLVGDEITIVQEEHWTSPTTADVTVTIPGKPGDMSGVARLDETDEGTVQVIDLTVRVGIPLVGGKIEGLVADMLSKAMDKEHQVGVEWLAG